MLSQHIIDQLQPYGFDRLAHKEKDGRRRLRLIALAHLKDGQELYRSSSCIALDPSRGHALGAVV